ncbi:MAG: alginate export family protein [Pseudomonadota bacterium]
MDKVWTGAAIAAAAMAMCSGVALAQPASLPPPADLISAIQQGTPILEFRPRYEHAEQAGVADGDAFTMRTRLGWETAAFHGFKALIEVEDVRQLGGSHYNDGVPPAEPYASISDPEVTEINRAQLAWTVNPHLGLTFGRQRITLDDQRFIGNSAWRQDEQTFDGVRADLSFGKFKATYAYISHVNRVLAEAADWNGDINLFNASYAANRAFKLTGFAYLLDFDRPTAALAQSSSTYGVRVTGSFPLSAVQIDYAGAYAQQSDYGSNPARFNLDYWEGEINATYGIVTGRVMYESLEGNGTRGFSTPLASLHPFNGWADVFTTTPANGLRDFNVSATVRPPISAPFFSNLALIARHHEFETERMGADLGDENDVQATATITPHLTALVKYADYDGPGSPPDTKRMWFGLEFHL